ncbi:uncharacterized protein LOC143674935 isoform X2 [Tamandua tetradactyla]|uniref:uncharacterized protein LOC143674935 isoform X2 n=1 Tax=Tamandua tetradactyla TaxID=48850 RepID=UPI004053B916
MPRKARQHVPGLGSLAQSSCSPANIVSSRRWQKGWSKAHRSCRLKTDPLRPHPGLPAATATAISPSFIRGARRSPAVRVGMDFKPQPLGMQSWIRKHQATPCRHEPLLQGATQHLHGMK